MADVTPKNSLQNLMFVLPIYMVVHPQLLDDNQHAHHFAEQSYYLPLQQLRSVLQVKQHNIITGPPVSTFVCQIKIIISNSLSLIYEGDYSYG